MEVCTWYADPRNHYTQGSTKKLPYSSTYYANLETDNVTFFTISTESKLQRNYKNISMEKSKFVFLFLLKYTDLWKYFSQYHLNGSLPVK